MRQTIRSDKAPAAVGPYSQAVSTTCATMLFCSGQIALDSGTGEMVGRTAAEQCRKVMENLGAVLEAAGADFDDVVKTTIYLADMRDFGAVNDVYASCFASDPPARVTVQVAGLPKEARVEIDAIAVVRS
ncbi:MAG TPA: RidA family protein [Acidobacteriota bacterium]|nr:RidA family protein [Acidobacteriota bacterium]